MKKKPRVLVLEDDRISSRLLVRILEEAGYEAIECGEGRDAIHSASMHPPMAMVVDVMLPDMRGTDVVVELRRQPDCAAIQPIFLTSSLSKKTSDRDRVFSFAVDGQNYPALPKPVSEWALIALLKRVELTTAQAERERRERELAEAAKSQTGAQPSGDASQAAPDAPETVIESLDKPSLWRP